MAASVAGAGRRSAHGGRDGDRSQPAPRAGEEQVDQRQGTLAEGIEALLEAVRGSVRKELTQHQLAIGDAGSGKTMLASAVAAR